MTWTGLILFREKCDRVGNSVQQFVTECDRVGQKHFSMGLDITLILIVNNNVVCLDKVSFAEREIERERE